MVVRVVGGWGVSLLAVCDCAVRCRSKGVGGTCPRVHAPHAEVVRAKIVLLAADGVANTVIAERLDVHVDVVSRWRKRFCEKGIDGLADRKRSGRPRVFAAEVVAGGEGDGVCAAERNARVPLSRRSSAELGRPGARRGAGGVGVGLHGACAGWPWTRSSRGSSGRGSSREDLEFAAKGRPGRWICTSGSGWRGPR